LESANSRYGETLDGVAEPFLQQGPVDESTKYGTPTVAQQQQNLKQRDSLRAVLEQSPGEMCVVSVTIGPLEQHTCAGTARAPKAKCW